MGGVVIIGAGQAGFQTADSLRQEGYDGTITLIGDEPHPPYQRPPLSKAYLLGETDRERLKFRGDDFFEARGIALLTERKAIAIDRSEKSVTFTDGARLGYDKLVIATGARVRRLPVPGAELDDVHYLKTLDDVDRIGAALGRIDRVAVIGAGFIGLEFAAVARKLGKAVTVIEALDRVMARVVTPDMSAFFTALHRSHGVDIVCGAMVAEVMGENGAVSGVRCKDGREFAAGLVVVGIGVIANIELAQDAGLDCDNGILTDGQCRTSDPDIFAVGDCASALHPFAGGRIRLESVQNAVDGGRVAAAAIAGGDKVYDVVPWFWSDQYDVKLQMVGLTAGCDDHVVRGDIAEGKFSLFHYRGAELRAVDSVNRAADHMLGRKLLAAGVSPSKAQASNQEFPLKSLL